MTDDQKHAEILQALRALPDLCAQLDPTERTPGPKMHGTPGSRPPLRLDVIDLLDTRRKREFDWLDISAGGDDRHGVLPSLEWWTRWVHADRADADLHQPELADTPTIATECGYLASVWDYVGAQDYAGEIRSDIKHLLAVVQHALGIRREYTPACRRCRNALSKTYGPEGDGTFWYECPWCGKVEDLNSGLRDLGRVQLATLAEISDLLDIPVKTLHRWHKDGLLKPEHGERRRDRQFAIADARRLQDTLRRA